MAQKRFCSCSHSKRKPEEVPSCPPPAPSKTQHKTCQEEKALRRGAHQEVRCRLESDWGGLLREEENLRPRIGAPTYVSNPMLLDSFRTRSDPTS
jgi:hypothetical protein